MTGLDEYGWGISLAVLMISWLNYYFADEKYTGNEPIWDYDRALTFSNEEFDRWLAQNHDRLTLMHYRAAGEYL